MTDKVKDSKKWIDMSYDDRIVATLEAFDEMEAGQKYLLSITDVNIIVAYGSSKLWSWRKDKFKNNDLVQSFWRALDTFKLKTLKNVKWAYYYLTKEDLIELRKLSRYITKELQRNKHKKVKRERKFKVNKRSKSVQLIDIIEE